MTTALERLVQLSGLSGVSAAQHLKKIGSGVGIAAGALLVAYSGLPTATAAGHILVTSGRASEQYYLAGKIEGYPISATEAYPVTEQEKYPVTEQETYPVTEIEDYPLTVAPAFPINLASVVYPISNTQTYPLNGQTQTYG